MDGLYRWIQLSFQATIEFMAGENQLTIDCRTSFDLVESIQIGVRELFEPFR